MQLTNTSKGPRGVNMKNGTTVYIASGATVDIDAEAPFYEGIIEGDGNPELEDMKVVELKVLAQTENIDLGDATTKADIISTIELSREAG